MEEILQPLPVAELVPSLTNPRKTFNDKAMQELTESIKVNKIFEPLLVRPVGANYEIVHGERRWRASKMAKLEEVPCIIRDMTDDEVITAQLVSFVQSVDIMPLEEARAFEMYFESKKKKVSNAEIALRFGKDAKYIAGRRQLNKLTGHFKDLLHTEVITLKAALEISKLPSSMQDDLKKALKYRSYDTDDILDTIKEEFFSDLHSAPFKKDDKKLLPSAGACNECPKHSLATPDLFGDTKKKDLCLDRKCFQAKLDAFVEVKTNELIAEGMNVQRISGYYRADSESKAMGTEGYDTIPQKDAKVFGIYVDGNRKGEVVGIRLSGSKTSKSSQPPGEKKAPDMKRRLELYKRRLETHENRIEFEVRKRLIKEIFKAIKTVSREDMYLLMEWIDRNMSTRGKEREWIKEALGMKRWIYPEMKAHQLLHIALGYVLTTKEMQDDPTMTMPVGECFRDLVARYKIDRAAIKKTVTAEMKSKEPKKPVQEKAKK